ncbi:MAG: protein TolQ [Bdellovibrionaceae bacterium]|nr:protein TolQ [Pseudobdellovibrionaceae bacterium]
MMIQLLFSNYAHAAEVEVKMGAWHAIASAGPIVKLTLLILVFMSIFSWMIIFSKRAAFKKVRAQNKKFVAKFWKSTSFEDVLADGDEFRDSTLFKLFENGYKDLKEISQMDSTNSMVQPSVMLQRSLAQNAENQISALESRLNFLATTGSSGPFIGLFGTVWGIMSAFQKIGETKMASLAVVAPGISEALIATAIGLAAAIPASIAYNHYIGQIRKEEVELHHFANEFLTIAEKNLANN